LRMHVLLAILVPLMVLVLLAREGCS